MDRNVEDTAAKLTAIELLRDVAALEQALRLESAEGDAGELHLHCRAIAQRLRQLARKVRSEDELDGEQERAVPDLGTAMLMAFVEAIRRLLNVTLRSVGLKEIPPLFGPEVDVSEDALSIDEVSTWNVEDNAATKRALEELLDQLFSAHTDRTPGTATANGLQDQLQSRLAAFRERFPDLNSDEGGKPSRSKVRP